MNTGSQNLQDRSHWKMSRRGPRAAGSCSSVRCAELRGWGVSLADQRRLFERDEDGAHAGDVLGLLAGLWVEVAEARHALPFRPGVVLVQLRHHGLLRRPADHSTVQLASLAHTLSPHLHLTHTITHHGLRVTLRTHPLTRLPPPNLGNVSRTRTQKKINNSQKGLEQHGLRVIG